MQFGLSFLSRHKRRTIMQNTRKMARLAGFALIAMAIAGVSPAAANQTQTVNRHDALAGIVCTANQNTGNVAAFNNVPAGAINQKTQNGSGNVMATIRQNAIDVAFVPNTATNEKSVARLGLGNSNLALGVVAASTKTNMATATGGAIAASGATGPSSTVMASSGIKFGLTFATTVKTT
jgi:hypothetical protein